MSRNPALSPSSQLPRSPPTAPLDEGLLGGILGWVLTVGGALGALSAATLLIEKINSLADSAYIPTCSINPVLSCGSVMSSEQAEVFGFPNPMIGVAAFPVVTTLGVLLIAGVRPPAWIWRGLQLGVTLGIVFVHWLIWQSLYEIGALCPYCMAVWAVMIAVFWYTTLYNVTAGHLGRQHRLVEVGATLARYHSAFLTGWYLLVTALITAAFWSYWSTLLR